MGEAVCACGQPSPDGYLCKTCTHHLQLALIAAAILGPDLDVARSRQARITEHAGGRVRSSALPYDVRAAAAAMALHAALSHAAMAINGQQAAEITPMAMALLAATPRIRQHPDAATILATIADAVHHAQRAIDRPPARVYAGPCPNCGNDLLGQPGRTVIYCPCGMPSVIAERQEAMRAALEDHLGNAMYASRVCTGLGCPISDTAIRKWAERGKLTTHGGLYRIGDVLDLALAMRARLAQRG
jgi:hypothetical protein